MKKIFIASVLLLAFSANIFSQGLYGNFINAYSTNDYQNCVKYGTQLLTYANDPGILYRLSQCYSGDDKPDESLKILNRLADWGLPYKISENPKLQKLKSEKDYKNLLAKFEKNLRPVNTSENAFILSDDRFIPEGITSLSDGSKFYVGSVAKNKIIEYATTAGQERNFTESSQDGIWSVAGMKVSPDNKQLWVCSFSERVDSNGYSGIFGFDLKTGKLIAKYISDNKSGPHLFNDLVITKEGQLYFTDSKAGKVFTINKETKQIESSFKRDFIYPNGIALDEKRNAIFVADFSGLTRIDLKTGEIISVGPDNMTYLQSIDGLYFYEDSLVAVQNNGDEVDRVARFYLDKSQTKIIGVKILQSFHTDFNVPTTGTIVGDDFYYIANSYVSSLKPDGTIADSDKLKKPVIKRINLKAASK